MRRMFFVHFVVAVLPPTVFVLNDQTVSSAKDVCALPFSSAAQVSQLRRSVLNINNLWLLVRNDEIIGRDSVHQKVGTYPNRFDNILYCDQLIWTGKVKNGQQPKLRTRGGYYDDIWVERFGGT